MSRTSSTWSSIRKWPAFSTVGADYAGWTVGAGAHSIDLLVFAEETEDLPRAGPFCAGREDSLPPLGVQMLAYRLEARPSMSLWQRKSEADSRKLGLAPKVGDPIHLNFEAP